MWFLVVDEEKLVLKNQILSSGRLHPQTCGKEITDLELLVTHARAPKQMATALIPRHTIPPVPLPNRSRKMVQKSWATAQPPASFAGSNNADGSMTVYARARMYPQPTTMEMQMAVRIPYAPNLSDDLVSSVCHHDQGQIIVKKLGQSDLGSNKICFLCKSRGSVNTYYIQHS